MFHCHPGFPACHPGFIARRNFVKPCHLDRVPFVPILLFATFFLPLVLTGAALTLSFAASMVVFAASLLCGILKIAAFTIATIVLGSLCVRFAHVVLTTLIDAFCSFYEPNYSDNHNATKACAKEGCAKAGVHEGITCDKSGMSPIVGNRYHLVGHNYDLCKAEFDKLDEKMKALFKEILPPSTENVNPDVITALIQGLPNAPLSVSDRESVRVLQHVLIKLGKMVPEAIRLASGRYGRFTTTAVADIQRSLGITPTGIYDEAVRAQLLKELTAASAPACSGTAWSPATSTNDAKVAQANCDPRSASELLSQHMIGRSVPSKAEPLSSQISSTSSLYTLSVNIAGVKREDLAITLEGSNLLVKGESKVGNCTYKVDEVFPLPEDTDFDAVSSKHELGLLHIMVPKRAPTTMEDREAEWLGEWDAILDDLKEMGFGNHDLNRHMLKKHSGAIKSAVKELVGGRVDKAPTELAGE